MCRDCVPGGLSMSPGSVGSTSHVSDAYQDTNYKFASVVFMARCACGAGDAVWTGRSIKGGLDTAYDIDCEDCEAA